MNVPLLKIMLEDHESLRLLPYTDSTNHLTIGVGRNLTDVGISREEAMWMLEHDIAKVLKDLDKHLPWWRTLTENRQLVLADMCFNLGIGSISSSPPSGLLSFRQTLASIQAGDYHTASSRMLKSKWAKQVGKRAENLSEMMKKG